MSDELTSVLIASYGHERYVERCLESVVDQSAQRIELVLVDDASSDRTFDVASRFIKSNQSRFERVVVVRNSHNRGASFSWSRAISLSEGRYLALLNSDDEFTSERLEILRDAAASHSTEFVFSAVETIDEENEPTFDEILCQQVMFGPRVALDRFPSRSWAMLTGQLAISTGNFFIGRELAQQIGPFAPYLYCHDWDFMLRACWFTEPFFVPDPLYRYRVHGRNSFKALGHLAADESRSILEQHVRRSFSTLSPNTLYPSPHNWPGSFRALASAAGIGSYVDALYKPYRPQQRTVRQTVLAEQQDRIY